MSILEKKARQKSDNIIRAIVLTIVTFLFHGFYVLPTLWAMDNLQQLPDILFDTLPFIPMLGYVADYLWIAMLCYFFFINRNDHNLLIYFTITAGVIMFTRSLCVLVNPTMPPLGMTNQITFTIHEFAPGMFFSGHVANSLLVYLMMPVRKTWMLCMSMIIATLLVISHAHYTVDIIGGYAIGWSLYCFCEKYLKHIFLGRI
jgi:hypothetical protein